MHLLNGHLNRSELDLAAGSVAFDAITPPNGYINEQDQSPNVNGPSNEDKIGISLPPGSNLDAWIDQLLASWVVLLYRYCGDTFAHFTWGCKDVGSGSRVQQHVPVDQLNLGSLNTASEVLDAIRRIRSTELIPIQQIFPGDWLIYLNDGELSKGARTSNEESDWKFQIMVERHSHELRISPQWKPPTMARYQATSQLEAFADLFRAVTESPEQPIREMLRISENELQQLWDWNTPVPPQIDRCMHDIITDQAFKYPQKLAVESWDGNLSYHEVDVLSIRLAKYLSTFGMVSQSIIPLCFEKSKWTIVALLAVMKAGGAFALLDPSQPEGRLRTIIEQTAATIMLTSSRQYSIASRIASGAEIIAVSQQHFDDPDSYPIQKPFELPPVPASAPLYVQFTSGSTGKPKGVVISHANYTSGAIPRAEAVGYKSHSRVLDFASYAFDVSIDCMLCTLAAGGTLCTPSEDKRINDLSGAIREMSVNMAHMTPSVARVLDPDILPSLEVLGLGGESVSASDAASWERQTKVIIAYGPSECTVGCTINNHVGGRPYTTIGRGVGGTTWVVNPADHNWLTPIGSVGELLIEGPIVGIGYLGEPDKTSEVYIEDPAFLLAGSKDTPGRHGRLYKTGDLVKYDADGDGCIIFVGRADQQVKLRGQRVELSEIEYNMRSYLPSGTSVAAEVIKPGGIGEPTLVAFLAEQKEHDRKDSLTGDLLSTFSAAFQNALAKMNNKISKDLPGYMIPAAYIPLHRIPQLVSCKTDRKRLREIGLSMSRQDLRNLSFTIVERQEPTSAMELSFHHLWRKVLGDDVDYGTNDNFFSVGGDSLKAMKLVATARSEGISLTVANILTNPTLGNMAKTAKAIDPQKRTEITPFSLLEPGWDPNDARAKVAELCGLEPGAVEDVYPCTPLQEGLMALSAKFNDAYIAQRVVHLPDLDTAWKLHEAFYRTAEDCAILRTRIVQVSGHGLVQVVVKGGISLCTADDLEKYLSQDRENPMDLGKPLVRYAIIHGGEHAGVQFALTIHHALYDGWSMPLVVDRVNRAYGGMTTERPAAFKDFIKYLGNLERKTSEMYWRKQLQGATGPQFPALPYSGCQTQADSLLEHYVSLPNLAASSTTVATAIRCSWAHIASIYTGTTDTVFGETLTGRNAPVPGVEEIEGPMITTVPVRIQINRDATVSDFLQDVHSRTIRQIEHEHLGLQHIRRLSPDAREACELRTGLVLHPATTEEDASLFEPGPADGFVPANDAEAAKEALKFNTYALMLVISLDAKGFLIMASFDSKPVQAQLMEKILQQFGRVVEQYCVHPTKRIADIEYMTNEDREEVWQASSIGPRSLDDLKTDLNLESIDDVVATWIVDPSGLARLMPKGAIGELLLEGSLEKTLPGVNTPNWLSQDTVSRKGRGGSLFKTGQLAKYNPDCSITLVRKKNPCAPPADHISDPKLPELDGSMRSAKQKTIQQLWSRVLHVPENDIGLNDNFFQLGGDSIGAMKLVSEARLLGLKLTVAQMFKYRSLYNMADAAEEIQHTAGTAEAVTPFSTLGDNPVHVDEVKPLLANANWKIVDIYPARPLQEIAVNGTVDLPRYSVRYELIYFDEPVDRKKLFQSCQELVSRNEILRTVFVQYRSRCLGVVLEDLKVESLEISSSEELSVFAHRFCDQDIHTQMSHGSSFVKIFLLGHPGTGQSCLAFRISHAQYDEIMLPTLLTQLSALYNSQPLTPTLPFSAHVDHVLRKNKTLAIPYWRNLLAGSTMTRLPHPTPLSSRQPVAVHKEIDISNRNRDITIATLPTAAWALTLARRLQTRDVVFGEVVSGRNIGLEDAEKVMGPCWQYIPIRVVFDPSWTVRELLEAIQRQHITSAAYEGLGLSEIVEHCTDWKDVDWFDSVVHQDTYHVSELEFGDERGEVKGRFETVYPHLEPLREWKVQAFVGEGGEKLTMEIVTFEEWADVAKELLKEIEGCLGMFMGELGEKIFN